MPIRYNSNDNRVVYSKTPLTSIMKGGSNCIYGNDIGYSAIFNYTKNGESVTITGLTAYGKQLSIIKVPSKIEDISVTELSSSSFNGCTNLVSVTIPDSVTGIGQGAFSGCRSLEAIIIPFVGAEASKTSSDNYRYLFGYIFGTSSYAGGTAVEQEYYKSSIFSWESITYYIPSSLRSVTVTGGDIPYGAFYNCSMLTSVTVPDSVTSIGQSAFEDCTSLTSVTIGNGVTSIGPYAFLGCTSLTSIIIPDSVTSIGQSAFNGCGSLKSITLPFVGATKDGTEDTHFGYIFGASRYSNNDDYVPPSLKEVIITGGASIGGNAFYNCSGLTSVTIGNSVTSIGYQAFVFCYSLTSVIIPDSVTSIGSYAFSRCDRLRWATFEDTSGWQVSTSSSFSSYTELSSSDLAPTWTAATYLTTTYVEYYWRKV